MKQMLKWVLPVYFFSVAALAYDHKVDFQLHPEADLICSNEDGLVAIGDFHSSLKLGDRGLKTALTLSVSTFEKLADDQYIIYGKMRFQMFSSGPHQHLQYKVQVEPKAWTAGVARVTSISEGRAVVSAEMPCSRRP